MVLQTIYIVRHGLFNQFRSNWVVDPATGEYSATVKSPTNIPSDPALASYGVSQATQLGSHLASVSPKVDVIYSSPFYRCIQTLVPFTDSLASAGKVTVHVEPGLGEFYGLARFDHPSPASIEVLNEHFKHLHAEKDPIIVPSSKGESIPGLHDRVAYCLHELIARLDRDPAGPKTLLICTHAAGMICMGRALTGRMPNDEGEEDFKCFTCAFSKFTRKESASEESKEVESWRADDAETVPSVDWQGGRGVGGGWTCEVNGDCSFLENGEERGWDFNIEKNEFTQVKLDDSNGGLNTADA
ncbi:hypothetical protein B0A48_17703 [Cryoendolithus antarcticus]|uniref:Transcription factor tau 55 kDa subunit n=1 Tax=Cryoendolithus antarcticus TaxID=1507870 RepID=A0A1V8SAM9_9PEZI|nr:hypothetical protein B0A48_17703 [Cryoendolithus antarcticus]